MESFHSHTPISAFAVYERRPVCQGQEDATSLQIMPGAGGPPTHPRAALEAYVSPVCRNQVRGEERPVTDIDEDSASAKEINILALGTIKLSTVLPSFPSAAALLAPRAGLTFFYSLSFENRNPITPGVTRNLLVEETLSVS